ncbi:uncharacterized protein LOC111303961 [Durio zibethinus]|uniref:Uncharacterized protein LOC111303961 n=1 Tax=Durio zibethinus TaxID=66656 RepID=A0A6P5ZV46_DURZI|nr:uncharacterized protein LOC111303961 [Durio zibethinus]
MSSFIVCMLKVCGGTYLCFKKLGATSTKQGRGFTIWGIWGERNNEIHGEQTKTTQAIAAFIKQYHAEFNNAQVACVNQPTWSKYWLRPVEGRVKVNFDGALAKQDRKGGARIVIRDHNGQVLGAATIQIHAVNDLFLVESRAAVLSLQFAPEMGFTNIELKGDCFTVVRSLNMTIMDFSRIGVIIEETRRRMSLFHSCNVLHVLRSGNRHLINWLTIISIMTYRFVNSSPDIDLRSRYQSFLFWCDEPFN